MFLGCTTNELKSTVDWSFCIKSIIFLGALLSPFRGWKIAIENWSSDSITRWLELVSPPCVFSFFFFFFLIVAQRDFRSSNHISLSLSLSRRSLCFLSYSMPICVRARNRTKVFKRRNVINAFKRRVVRMFRARALLLNRFWLKFNRIAVSY